LEWGTSSNGNIFDVTAADEQMFPRVVLTLYICFAVIVLLNLLVAMMNSRYESAKVRAEQRAGCRTQGMAADQWFSWRREQVWQGNGAIRYKVTRLSDMRPMWTVGMWIYSLDIVICPLSR